jgi:hypothetical protein
MFYKISQLTLNPGKKNNSIDEVFVAQPDSRNEGLAGRLFAIIKIESREADYLKFVNFLLPEMNHQYYQNEKLILRERLSTIKIDHIFESALAKTNKSVSSLVQNDKLRLQIENLNIMFGVIYENELHFASIGKNRAFLIFRAPGKDDEYKISEVASGTEPTGNWNKLFGSVVSGHLPPGGYFLFTNETLPEFLSQKQLKEIITALPPGGAVEQIKNLLQNINSFVAFSAILIKNTTGQPAESTRLSVQNARTSISNLQTTENSTEKLLAPSGMIDFHSWLNRLRSKFPRLPQTLSAIDREQLKNKIFFKKRPSFDLVKKILKATENGFLYFLSLLYTILKTLAKPQVLKTAPSKFAAAVTTGISSLIAWFKGLNIKLKLVLAVALVSFLVFLANSLYLNRQNITVEQKKNYDGQIAEIVSVADRAEADLLYNNETAAKADILELKRLLDGLPVGVDPADERVAAARKRLDEFTEKIKHLVKLNGGLVFDTTGTAGGMKLSDLVIASGKLIAAGGNVISVYDPIAKKSTSTTIAASALSHGNVSGDNVFYYADGSELTFNFKTYKTGKLAVTLPTGAGAITANALYNNKLYLLAPAANQIYKFNRTGDKFDGAAAWFTEPADLAGATSLYINGDIYVAKADGRALKYLKGKQEVFSLETVEPPIESASKIIVTSKKQYAYLVEGKKERVIIFDKGGKFIKQYQLTDSAGLADIAIDEQAKKIYWLADGKIFETPASEL